MSDIQDGFYDCPRAHGREAVIDQVGQNNNPILKVPFVILVDEKEHIVTGEFWLTEGAMPFTYEKLAATGWSGSFKDLASIGSKPCRVLVKIDGGGYPKVDGVWPEGGGGLRVSNPVDDAGLDRLEAMVAGIKSRSTAAAPAAAQPVDDLPF